MAEFTHFNESGRARMVDVSAKGSTERAATAQATVFLQPGDVVLELNRQPISNFAMFQRLADPIKPSDLALLLVNRQGNALYIPIQGE